MQPTRNIDHKDRLIRAFVAKKGHGDYGVKVDFSDDEDDKLVWKTIAPPEHYWDGDENWERLLLRKGWLRRDGYLELPRSLTAPLGHEDWRTLEAYPDVKPWNKVSKTYSPISRLADFLVICHEEDADMLMTQRQKTEYRLNLNMYKRRTFTKDMWEAAQYVVLIFLGYPDPLG